MNFHGIFVGLVIVVHAIFLMLFPCALLLSPDLQPWLELSWCKLGWHGTSSAIRSEFGVRTPSLILLDCRSSGKTRRSTRSKTMRRPKSQRKLMAHQELVVIKPKKPDGLLVENIIFLSYRCTSGLFLVHGHIFKQVFSFFDHH